MKFIWQDIVFTVIWIPGLVMVVGELRDRKTQIPRWVSLGLASVCLASVCLASVCLVEVFTCLTLRFWASATISTIFVVMNLGLAYFRPTILPKT